ncbi:MAG TPA: ribonuclease HII [Thermoplasmata archaeon]|nr:ribonuclease HII [Thermoplasmata archaeon]
MRGTTGREAVERILGLDEAGRGSVIGPLVVGGFLVERSDVARLIAAGARDSKALTPGTRERVYLELPSIGECDAIVLPPREIDQYVARGRLNELEARAFGALVARLGPDEVHADACDPVPRRFARAIARWSGRSVRILARHHADRDDPIVGAASIVAKVRRDRAIELLRRQLGDGVGSGYPSDPRTIEFLRERLRAEVTVPGWVRASWSTMQRVKPDRPACTLDSFEV